MIFFSLPVLNNKQMRKQSIKTGTIIALQSPSTSCTASATNSESIKPPQKKRKSIFTYFFSEDVAEVSNSHSEKEVQSYLDEPYQLSTKCPLLYWKSKAA